MQVLRFFFLVLFSCSIFLATAGLVWASEPDKDITEISTEAKRLVLDRIIVEGEKILSISESQSIKTPTPIIDVPQSLTIITAEEIAARGFDSLAQIIDYTPGVTTSQGEGHRDALVFRGIRSTADFFTDGHRDDMQYYRALYNVQQVEILRGPNALLFGRGGTGGILNRVSKKPELEREIHRYMTHVDSLGAYGLSFDSNHSIDADQAVRLNLMYESLQNDRDFYNGERIGFNPTFQKRLGADTVVDVSYEYIDHRRFIDRGIPTNEGRPATDLREIVFADPKNNYHRFSAHVARTNMEHFFADGVKGNFNFFYGDYDKVYANYYAVDYDRIGNQVRLDGYIDDTHRQTWMISSHLVGEFETGLLAHTLIAGAELIHTKSNQSRFNPVFTSNGQAQEWFRVERPIRFFGGMGTNASGEEFTVEFSAFNDDTRVRLDVSSLFIQNEVQITSFLDVVLGLRFDRFDIEAFNADPGQLETRRRVDEEITPRAGLIWKPQENMSLYASYSESFLPRSGEQYASLSGTNDALKPDVFSNQEMGFKWDLNRRLSLTVAAFKNTQRSPQVADSDPKTLDIIKSNIRGAELQLSGRITDRLYATTNYSYLDGEVIDRFGPTGLRLRELPKTMASLWSTYELNDDWGFGVGVTYQGKSFADNANSAQLPSYVRLDLSAYRDLSDRLRVQVNIENITNERYFPNAHSLHQISVGAPRHLMFTLLGSF